MCENKAEIIIDRFIDFDGFCSNQYRVDMLRWCKKFYMNVPTACIVEDPRWVVPLQARGFCTSRYISGGVILDYKELIARSGAKTGDARVNLAILSEICLYEYWADEGSDGHMDYQHLGYVFCAGLRYEDGAYPVKEILNRINKSKRRDTAEAKANRVS